MNRQTFMYLGFCIIGLLLLLTPGSMMRGQNLGNRHEGYLKINYYLNLNDFENAEKLIDTFLSSYPDDPYILTEKAFLSQNIDNEPEKTLRLLNKALTVHPDYYYANYLKASLLFTQYPDNKGKIDEAIKLLELSIKDTPDFYDNYYLMGIILSDREDYAGSNSYFEKANRLEEKLAVYYYMATNYHMLKNREKESEIYEKILSLDPTNYKALRTLSQIYMDRGQYKKAVIYLEKLLSGNPGTRKIAEEYLYSLFASGEYEKFKKITALIKLDQYPLLVYGRAYILSREKKLDEALKLLERIKHKDTKYYILLADIFLTKHEPYRAFEILEKVEMNKREYIYYSLKMQTLLSLNLNKRLIKLFHQIRANNAITEKLSVNDYYSVLYAYANINRLGMVREVAKFAKSHLIEGISLIDRLIERLENFSPETPLTITASESSITPDLYLLLTLYKKQEQYDHARAVVQSMIQKTDKKDLGRSLSLQLELCDIYMSQKKFDLLASK